ncbi:MAG: hypothetical protein HN936_09420 [Bacteroidetes bacterium]|nr:hypothetical protein [Bacteroidota bacterium]MBT5426909.1 hypothetical protein [Bacteroidota bacterium]MBT7093454.1 hypothetical protein [Bacteroidota bacterium]
MKTNINKFKPAVSNQILVSLAGLLWILVGIMLVSHALTWYKEFTSTGLVYYIVAGVLFGLIIHHWGFLKIVNKNLIRIHLIETKYCLFGFMPWKSYILIAIMMTFGIILRYSTLPRIILSIIYMAIGLALGLSSIRYFRYAIFDKSIYKKQ